MSSVWLIGNEWSELVLNDGWANYMGGGVSLTCRYMRYMKGVGTLARENETY